MKTFIIPIVLLFIGLFSSAQSEFVIPDSHTDKIKFKLLNNLIVFPVELNGVELSFLLDTGVSKPILFNIPTSETLQVNNVETINLQGLGGDGAIPAVKSENNILKIGSAVSYDQDIYVVFDESIDFTPRLGVTVHGIIGYDIFKDFVVEINYASKFLRLTTHDDYKEKRCRRCETLDLSIYKNKPYIIGSVGIRAAEIPVKLLIDSGSSDALWLFEDERLGIHPTYETFEDFLGKGLSGSVYGHRTKHESFSFKSFQFEDVNVAYPDSTSINLAKKHKERNGSVGAEILRRFNMVIDYRNASIILKRNRYFRQPFRYNRSGITLQQDGLRVVKEAVVRKSIDSDSNNQGTIAFKSTTDYKFNLKPSFTVVELRPNSPAELAGVQLGDIILTINGKNTVRMELHDVIKHFRDDVGKMIRLKVDREGELLDIKFQLEDIFK